MKNKKSVFFALAFTTAGALLNPVRAEESKTIQLPRIDVIGSNKASLLKTSGSAEYVTKEQLFERKPLSAQDAVKQVSGAHVVETEGFGLFPRIGLRGLSPDMSQKVLLLEDGAPIALGPFVEPASYYMPPIERMESIEVLKGSSSLRYGPSTIGGTINYVTKSPPTDPGGSLSLTGGNRNFQSALLEAGGQFENSSVLLNWLRTGGDGNRENNRFDVDDVMLKYGAALTDSHYVGAKLTYFRNQAQATYRGLTQSEYEANPFQNPAKDDAIVVNRIGFDLNHEWEINSQNRIKTLLYTNMADRDWWRQNLDSSTLELQNGNRGRLRSFTVGGIDSRWQSDYSIGSIENQAEIGVRLHVESMTNREVDGAENNSRSGTLRTDELRGATAQAIYAQNKLFITDRWDITPGVRVESYTQTRNVLRSSSAAADAIGNASNTEFVPGIGTGYRLAEEWQIFAGAHRGFAPPRVQDSINLNGSLNELEAERSLNLELGVRHLSQDVEFEFTAFQLDFSNQIVAATQSGGLVDFEQTNAGQTLHQGFETFYRLLSLKPIVFDLSWTYVPVAKLNTFRLIDSIDRNGNRLSYAPEHVITAGLGFQRERWSLRAEYMFVSEQFADLQNTAVGSANGRTGLIPSYSLVNLSGDWQVHDRIQLFGSVKNALDQRYIASRAPQGIFTGLRQMAFVGIRGSF